MDEHEFREARIAGVTARALTLIQRPNAPQQYMTVKDAADADRAMGDPENHHHCPLCNNEFGTAAFKAHAPACIEKHAPRQRVWLPAGTKGAIQAHAEERPRRPGGGIFGGY